MKVEVQLSGTDLSSMNKNLDIVAGTENKVKHFLHGAAKFIPINK